MAIAELPKRRRHNPPQLVALERHAIVGAVMDSIARVQDSIFANGAAIQLLRRMRPGPERNEALRAACDTHVVLSALLAELRAQVGELDRTDSLTT